MKRTFLVVVEGASAAAAWFEPENIHILLDAAGVKINVTETTNVTPPPDAAIVEKVRELAALRRQAQEEDVKNFTDLSEYVESTAFKRDARISALIEEICALVSPPPGEKKENT